MDGNRFAGMVRQAVAPLQRRVMLMLGRAVLAASDDAQAIQLLQVQALPGEDHAEVEAWQDYGLTTHPIPGAEILLGAIGGNRDHLVAIRVGDRRYRLTGLAQGEVALHDDQAQTIHLTRDGIVVSTAQAEGVTVIAPKVTVLSDDINLGGPGGEKVARVGDLVQVGAGSSAGSWPIVEGSERVRAT